MIYSFVVLDDAFLLV